MPSLQKILIIIVLVSIFGLLIFVYVKNKMKRLIDFYLQKEKTDKEKSKKFE